MLQTRSSAMWTLPSSADECVTGSGEPREPYQAIFAEALGSPERLYEMQRGAEAWFASRHITFGVPAADRAPSLGVPVVLDRIHRIPVPEKCG